MDLIWSDYKEDYMLYGVKRRIQMCLEVNIKGFDALNNDNKEDQVYKWLNVKDSVVIFCIREGEMAKGEKC